MQLKYTVKKWDVLISRLSFMLFNRSLLVFSILLICFMTWVMLPSQFISLSIPVRIFSIGFALIFSTLFYAGFQMVFNFILVLCSKNNGIEGSHTMEVKEDGLEESTDINKSLYRWNPAFRVREFKKFILIYPAEGKNFIIPKRREAYEGDLAGFCAALKAKVGGK